LRFPGQFDAVTVDHLTRIALNAPPERFTRFTKTLNQTLAKYGIITPLRQAHFLAQLMHESGEFRYLEEIASGALYDTGRKAQILGNTPAADKDGQFYKGRGLIQLTGKSNYAAYTKYVNDPHYDFVKQPFYLSQLPWAVDAAGWYWAQKAKLNDEADRDDIVATTKGVNGGLNGLEQRRVYLVRAKNVLGVGPPSVAHDRTRFRLPEPVDVA
jgi:putative chitinase